MTEHPLATGEIEKQIARYRLDFDPIRDDEIEWRYQPPPFVPAFIELTERLRRVPTQKEVREHYVEKNRPALRAEFASKWQDESVRREKERALLARLDRAYPSFVRDLYFLALLREHGLAAEYDVSQDVAEGVDLIVSGARHRLLVHVFLDSPRSRQGRAKKEHRHTFEGRHLDVVLSRDVCKRVGSFWLPTHEHVEQVRHALARY